MGAAVVTNVVNSEEVRFGFPTASTGIAAVSLKDLVFLSLKTGIIHVFAVLTTFTARQARPLTAFACIANSLFAKLGIAGNRSPTSYRRATAGIALVLTLEALAFGVQWALAAVTTKASCDTGLPTFLGF